MHNRVEDEIVRSPIDRWISSVFHDRITLRRIVPMRRIPEKNEIFKRVGKFFVGYDTLKQIFN